MMTLLMNSQGGRIRVLLSNSVQLNLTETFSFAAVWFLLTITTYGVAVPAGLFLPAIILGCTIGQLYLDVTLKLFPDFVVADSFIIVGAAAVLAGYTRQTYSVAVIMLETT
jgi:H+/Cl- antiporter ClcA